MKTSLSLFFIIIFSSALFAQGFNIDIKGTQTFNFKDDRGRNQAVFTSEAPLEDITGTANGISGTVSFDPQSFANSLKGKIVVDINSINTGIELRNNHMKGANWLDAENYPKIVFIIKKVLTAEPEGDNKIKGKVLGDFSLHGVTKEVTADFEMTYLKESEKTMKRAPGDLLGVRANFSVILSDFGIDNELVGEKVAKIVEVNVNIVGSNKM